MPLPSPSDAVVDGQVVSRTGGAAPSQQPPTLTVQVPLTPEGFAVADAEQKARAMTLFIRVPFFAFIALNGKLPPLVRIGAALLGIYDVRQLTRSEQEITQVAQDAQNLLPAGY